MTEDEWLLSARVQPLLDQVAAKSSERKARLFAVACLRQLFGDLMTDERCRRGLDVAERALDGDADPDEVRRAYADAVAAFVELRDRHFGPRPELTRTYYGGEVTAAQHVSRLLSDRWNPKLPRTANPYLNIRNGSWVLQCAHPLPGAPARPGAGGLVEAGASVLLRDLFGPLPHRSVPMNPRWRTPTVVALADAVYAERAFDRMPILADALEEAGCDDEQVLDHCRGDGPHVRGCWVVDLVLAKE